MFRSNSHIIRIIYTRTHAHTAYINSDLNLDVYGRNTNTHLHKCMHANTDTVPRAVHPNSHVQYNAHTHMGTITYPKGEVRVRGCVFVGALPPLLGSGRTIIGVARVRPNVADRTYTYRERDERKK